MKMADAKQKRNEQLKRWLGSETDQEPPVLKKKKTKVKFDDGAVFLAACSSGDTEEVLRMLDRGADINYANVDGLTALHQACIDDNVDMVTFLVENGAAINQPDNEGWIPLHAAASCGYLDIAEYLIAQGASVGVVNSEGETPLDIAEEEAMEELLKNEINKQGVDIEAARKEEERIMLRDARQWLNSGQIQDSRHAKSGGTALHVAAAKGYVEVLKLLIQTGYDVNIKDFDGWTPLHASAHWGKEEACRILVESLCDMDLINKMGQTAFDVADEDVVGHLEELQKKQNLLIGDKKDVKKSPLIEMPTTGDNNQSLKPIKSKETLLLEPEKSALRIETLEPEKVDEVEEGKKDESSCSSEEEDDEDSESETEADKSKPAASVSNSTTPAPADIPVSPPTSPTNQNPPPAGKVASKVVEDDRKDESPASWRLGLRKTGSYGALAEITATKEAQREKDTSGVMRSASSPRLSSSLDNKDKEKEKDKGTRLAYVAPTIPRRLASTSDIDEKENRDSTALIRSGSYTRRRWDDDLKNSEGSASTNRTPSYQRSSFGRRNEDLGSSTTTSPSSTTTSPSSTTTTTTTTTTSVTSPTGHRGLLSSLGSSSTRTGSTSLTSRYWSEESADREKEKESAAVIPTINTGSTTTSSSTTTTATSTTTGIVTGSERRRSYLTPVRDEESESQRKARSRQARQSRRSTQGVTLTDLQEAEKTIGRSRPPKTREEEKEEKEKQDKEKQEEKKEMETKEDDYRSKYRSLEERYRPSSSSSTSAISSVSTASTPYSSTGLSYSSSSLNRPNSLTGITSSYSRSSRDTEKEMDKREEEKEGEDKSQPRSIRDRRRPREKRRSTGVSFWTQEGDDPDQQSDSEDGSIKGEPQSDRLSRNESSTSTLDRNDTLYSRGYGESRRTYSSRLDRDDTTDYKKLYEQILAENEKLKAQLRDTDLELADLKLQLEKATQRQERYADRSQLEMEKRERRALERKISEMEEELKNLPQVKQVQALRQVKERLQAENRALSRVLAKLSQSACSQLPTVDL
ncbi:protein phosphatase 1 regulatory subunit 12A isoform X5 [Trematomus bernacchii]|uniref:protein phosphatase 1 regulatory subunit 12A isoform X5 n=1 Tax=Trematomus bernacchii TaxID=40690 RepID=UPI00146F480C|nr:protein phosphatase 1 regulatory subunit 12A isoform X5 [Trematomus bernacchii]